ncbi:hypothetical protein HanXRQr2_Chr11g0488621 [Helianthus annuus]|uniref:Uncharacterized protein n=1 Tax=Helianthus annuus TaxID=4232 RepID=A0A251TD05_HELAN|nr:hypothetical protein HanXRQr2_Chr11g0488621 [Helianthus annuus]KAJ0874986.1 hypothetical protein HanPSC8_Chr11g0470851 [Helianthus annuus]
MQSRRSFTYVVGELHKLSSSVLILSTFSSHFRHRSQGLNHRMKDFIIVSYVSLLVI